MHNFSIQILDGDTAIMFCHACGVSYQTVTYANRTRSWLPVEFKDSLGKPIEVTMDVCANRAKDDNHA